MPHDVTMPQLGMAQDAGRIVAWLKAPGETVAKGDALFEVETDKATMEVEAQAAGYLTGITAKEGDDVPVGRVIARISESADEDTSGPAPAPEPAAEAEPSGGGGDPLPEGRTVTMPQLGMAQDSGLLVGWLKAPGEAVSAGDLLFEVETDKSTMEVEAGSDGYLAATLAEAGEDVPVGEAMAIISAEKPDAPVARSARKAPKTQEAAAPAAEAGETDAATPAPSERPRAAPAPAAGGRILASPKARRLALEEGLDLARLAEAGHPQPFHVADLEALRALPETSPAAPAEAAAVARRLTAETDADGLTAFAAWAADVHGLTDAGALLAGLAGASLGGDAPVAIAVERFGTSRTYAVPPGRRLSEVTGTDAAPGLVVRDLRGTRLATVELGAEAVPVLTLASRGAGLSVTLECAPAHLDAAGAIRLLTDFAGRMREPLRHLL